MACLIAAILVGIAVMGGISGLISSAVYRYLLRTGYSSPVGGQIAAFIASFVVISGTVVIAV